MADARRAAQFSSDHQQRQAAELGMWTFLSSETLLFAGLFGLYASYANAYGPAFHLGRASTNHVLGATNTLVLLTSSFSAALSLSFLKAGRRRASVALVFATVAFGVCFLVLKAVEYHEHISHGMYPGSVRGFAMEHALAGLPLFVVLYYLMTGLHALHVTAGVLVLSVLGIRVARRRLDATFAHPLEFGVLYWHLVDLVWVFLWPMFYFARGDAG